MEAHGESSEMFHIWIGGLAHPPNLTIGSGGLFGESFGLRGFELQ